MFKSASWRPVLTCSRWMACLGRLAGAWGPAPVELWGPSGGSVAHCAACLPFFTFRFPTMRTEAFGTTKEPSLGLRLVEGNCKVVKGSAV